MFVFIDTFKDYKNYLMRNCLKLFFIRFLTEKVKKIEKNWVEKNYQTLRRDNSDLLSQNID